jgi:molybdenum cofactor cytidylyltransferase
VICAIVLAAGQSERMGTQKLLLPWGGTTVIGHIVEQLLHSALDQVIVVTGHDQTLVGRELAERSVTFTHNPHYASGMLSSVRCGIKALAPDCQAALVALGDQPMIGSPLIDQMITAFNATDKQILIPTCKDQRGHPLLFSRRYFSEILTDFDDTGLHGLLQVHAQDILELKVSTPSVLGDIDRPEDYQREREQFDGY